MVVPIKIGSGTRIKIIESMATGTPVVSSRVGAEGIQRTHNHDILLADSSEDIATAVVALLSDRNPAYQIGTAGRQLVETHYTWDAAADIMRREMQTI